MLRHRLQGTPVVVFVINAGPVDLSWAKDHVRRFIIPFGQARGDCGSFRATPPRLICTSPLYGWCPAACVPLKKCARLPSRGTRAFVNLDLDLDLVLEHAPVLILILIFVMS